MKRRTSGSRPRSERRNRMRRSREPPDREGQLVEGRALCCLDALSRFECKGRTSDITTTYQEDTNLSRVSLRATADRRVMGFRVGHFACPAGNTALHSTRAGDSEGNTRLWRDNYGVAVVVERWRTGRARTEGKCPACSKKGSSRRS